MQRYYTVEVTYNWGNTSARFNFDTSAEVSAFIRGVQAASGCEGVDAKELPPLIEQSHIPTVPE